jgi:hypothetical protein
MVFARAEIFERMGLLGWEAMWGASLIIYGVLKLMTWQVRRSGSVRCWKHWAYLLAWPGMNADVFLFGSSATAVSKPKFLEWIFASSKLLLGVALLFAVTPRLQNQPPLLIGWVGMIAVIMLLHFGIFHLLSCGWRAVGLSAAPIMNWPVLSGGLSEFWGQRWNLAFRDLTHKFVFRPLARRYGMTMALLIGFLVSGVIHDLVISIPAGGGYGWPTCYFALQGLGIVLEKSYYGRAMGLGRGWQGRLYTGIILLLPMSWLFHQQFVVSVFVPFLQALGVTP